MRYSARVVTILAITTGAALVSCGSSGKSSNDTLPPILTTTTTTTLPPTTTTIPVTYVIQSGDTLFSIAQQFGLSAAYLAQYNGIVNKDHIEVGQTLKLPQPGETTTTVAAVVDASSTTAATATTIAP